MGHEVVARFHGLGPDTKAVIKHVGLKGPGGDPAPAGGPGTPAISDEHFPGHTEKIAGGYTPRPRTKAEAEFLALGGGAAQGLLETSANGVKRINVKMAEAVELGKIFDAKVVDEALGTVAVHQRFAGDLASLINSVGHRAAHCAADEECSLTEGTGGWTALGESSEGARA